MKRKYRIILLSVVAGLMILGIGALWAVPRLARRIGVSVPGGSPGPVTLSLPPGFQATIFAQGLNRPRFMAYSADGVLFLAEMGAGRVVALPDLNDDGVADETVIVAEGLDRPSSLAFHQGWLYVGQTSQVIRLRLDEGLQAAEIEIVVPDLPTKGAHVTRTVVFGPDGQMFLSAGSSCNVCVEEDERRAAISVYKDDGSQGRVFARGLRNAVGLAINPWTGELWATNNGRDWLGDNKPPETVYVIRDGLDYGWPRCHNGHILDPEYGERGDCEGVEPPVLEMQAHSAPLGLTFYDGDQFPETYHGHLFVAFHGSWNRSRPTGYKVVHIPLEENRPIGKVKDFATGWLQEVGKTAPGRPVGLTLAPDGSLMVSDDKAGLVYCIRYQGR